MKEQFEHKIKENIKEFSIQPRNDVWMGISNALHQQKKRKAFAWWLPVTIFLVMVIVVSIYIKSTIENNYILNTNLQENNNKSENNSNNNEIAVEYNKISSLLNTRVKSPQFLNGSSNAKENSVPKIRVDSKYNASNKTNDNSPHINTRIIESDNADTKIDILKGLLAHDSLNELLHISQPAFKFKSVLFKNSFSKLIVATTKKNYKKLNLFYVGEIGLFTEKSNNLSEENINMQDALGNLSGTIFNQSQYPPIITLPKRGITVKLGILLEKRINNEIAVNTGIYYRFIANKQSVHNRVDSAERVFYTIGNKQLKTNTIHALGIPITFNYNFKLNKYSTLIVGAGGELQFIAHKKWLILDTTLKGYVYNNTYPSNLQINTNIMAGIQFQNNLKIMATLAIPVNNFYDTQLSSRTFLQSGLQVNYPLSFRK